MSRNCCRSGRGVPGTYAPDPYRSVSSISCSRCGSSLYNRLHRDQQFLFDLRDAHFPLQQYKRKLVQANKQTKFENMPCTCSRGKSKGTLASRFNQNSEWFCRRLEAYILWEKKGDKVQSWHMPVLYERSIACAASE